MANKSMVLQQAVVAHGRACKGHYDALLEVASSQGMGKAVGTASLEALSSLLVNEEFVLRDSLGRRGVLDAYVFGLEEVRKDMIKMGAVVDKAGRGEMLDESDKAVLKQAKPVAEVLQTMLRDISADLKAMKADMGGKGHSSRYGIEVVEPFIEGVQARLKLVCEQRKGLDSVVQGQMGGGSKRL